MIDVSIIIPTYKGEENVLIAVRSAIGQRNINKEIIVVDDNGEGSASQIRTYNKLSYYIDNNLITYVTHKNNKNGSAARNTGVEHSTGKYLIFLDDDDYIFPDMSVKMKDSLEKENNKSGFCVVAGFYVRDNGCGYIKKINKRGNFLYNYLMDKCFFNTSAMMIERNAFEKISGFDESFSRHQDWEFCSRLMINEIPVVVNEPLLIKYAQNRNAPSNTQKRAEQLEYFINKMCYIWPKKLTKREIDNIKGYRRRQVFIDFLIKKEVKKGLKYLNSYSNTFVNIIISMYDIVKFVIRRLFIGSKKVTYSYNEIRLKLKVE